MQNINPWLLSACVLSISGAIFMWLFGNTFINFFLAVSLALAVIPLVKVIQAKSQASSDFKMYRLVGGIISLFGTAVMTYFNLISSTAPNPRYAIVGSIIFAMGLAVLMVNRFKNESVKNRDA